MNNNVIAVIVTYNRLELLKRVIDSLCNQTKTLEKIIIVNNGSTDGTSDYLSSFIYNELFLIVCQENVGGSGGFYRGIQEAMKFDCDWIWCMDDDVFPRKDCLQIMCSLGNLDPNIGIITAKRIMNGSFFSSECRKLNLTNPFRRLHGPALTDDEIKDGKPIEMETMAFEGPLIRKQLVDIIGLPNKDLFILYDDTDYGYRCISAGYKLLLNPLAIIDKHYFVQSCSEEEFRQRNKWKLWYDIRNTSYFCHKYGKNRLFKSIGGFPCKILFSMIMKAPFGNFYRLSDIGKLFNMDILGRKEILGKL